MAAKFCSALIVLMLTAVQCEAAIAVVQRWTSPAAANDNPIAVSGVTVGNLLVACSSAATNTLSVTDDGGGTAWASATSWVHVDAGVRARCFYKFAEGAPTVINLITSGGGSSWGFAWEISGHLATIGSVLDVEGFGESATGTPSAAQDVASAISPTQNVLIVGMITSSSGISVTANPSGYTMLTATSASTAGDRTGSSGNTYTFATTTATTETWITLLAAFKEAAGGGGGNTGRMMLIGVGEDDLGLWGKKR